MTDSRTNNKYINALNEVNKLDKEPVGFSDIITTVPSTNIPIRQNNTIIQLIINLAEKVDQLEEQITEINQLLHSTRSFLPSELLVKNLENLSLGTNRFIRKTKINPFHNSKWNFLEEKEKK